MIKINNRIPCAYIDTTELLTFTFNGKTYYGFEGDTVASALLANAVRITARSFKYRRPRGITSSGPEEAGAYVNISRQGRRETGASPATLIRLEQGLEVTAINGWPNVNIDLLASLHIFKKVLSAGFYYKTFMWPNWKFFRPMIRKLAGIGTLPNQEDQTAYLQQHTHCHTLIIGGGISGLQAALSSASLGNSVLLIESEKYWGGQALWSDAPIEGIHPETWIANAKAKLLKMPNVRLLNGTTAFGAYEDNLITACQKITQKGKRGEILWKIRPQSIIYATGCIERPMLFPGNDRPGTMLAHSILTYAKRFGVQLGKNICFYTNHEGTYDVAIALNRLFKKNQVQAQITIIDPTDRCLTQKQADLNGILILKNTKVKSVSYAFGKIKHLVIQRKSPSGQPEQAEKLPCDCLGHSDGWTPTVHLFSQNLGKLTYDDEIQAFKPDLEKSQSNNIFCIGSLNAIFDNDNIISTTKQAIENIKTSAPIAPLFQKTITANAQKPQSYISSESPNSQFVDLMHDVKVSDIQQAAAEGFESVEHFKRYTTTGMAPDQGKTSNIHGIQVLGKATQRAPGAVGTTKYRPPYIPIAMGCFAAGNTGTLYQPPKCLTLAGEHEKLNALMEDYGAWQRPALYGDTTQASERDLIHSEVLNTRSNVSLLDYSPLCKVIVKGPDALSFLNFVFANNLSTIKPGKCRYGLVLNENGAIINDGVVACLTAEHFILFTTSANAEAFSHHLEFINQIECADLDVALLDITRAMSTLSINGPKSHELLTALLGYDLRTDGDFNHMSIKKAKIEGCMAFICRVSFTGEAGYEITVPIASTTALWRKLMSLGQKFGIKPLGLEALMVMRAEKGYIDVGLDTDATTIPSDIGWGPIIAKKKQDFIGKKSLSRPHQQKADREQLVGLKADGNITLPMGAIIVGNGSRTTLLGRVTSAYHSPTLGYGIALGLLRSGFDKEGAVVRIYDKGQYMNATVVKPCFLDAGNEKLKA